MQTFVLQDWVLIEGTNATDVIQTEPNWLDLSPFQDLIAWIDVRGATSVPTAPVLFLDTSPSKDDLMFASMNGAAGYPLSTTSSPPPPYVAQLQLGVAAVPLATFLRWRLRGPASSWYASIRIIIAANSPGWMQTSPDAPGAVQLPFETTSTSQSILVKR
jgi:hypothetical protein